jgi:hypothetical protein
MQQTIHRREHREKAELKVNGWRLKVLRSTVIGQRRQFPLQSGICNLESGTISAAIAKKQRRIPLANPSGN